MDADVNRPIEDLALGSLDLLEAFSSTFAGLFEMRRPAAVYDIPARACAGGGDGGGCCARGQGGCRPNACGPIRTGGLKPAGLAETRAANWRRWWRPLQQLRAETATAPSVILLLPQEGAACRVAAGKSLELDQCRNCCCTAVSGIFEGRKRLPEYAGAVLPSGAIGRLCRDQRKVRRWCAFVCAGEGDAEAAVCTS